jgi:hypothetical protein
MTDFPKPNDLSDLVLKSEQYLEFIRVNPKIGFDFIDSLAKYVTKTLSDFSIDKIILQKLAGDLIDGLYIRNIRMTKMDEWTHAYFGMLLKHLFFVLAKREVWVFYILDNKIRDDRFKIHCELCQEAGLSVVYPYDISKLQFNDSYTSCPTKEYAEVEKEITKAIYEEKHIIYVEKDDSINYLSNIFQIAEDWQNKYICIFRNKDINEPKNWLLGNFADTLKNKK